jgi:hypothetical protein
MNKFQAPGESCRENIQFLKPWNFLFVPFCGGIQEQKEHKSKSRDAIDIGDVSIKRLTSNSRAAYTSRDFSTLNANAKKTVHFQTFCKK